MKRVLVTGHDGFLGSAMVKYLEARHKSYTVITAHGLDLRDYNEIKFVTKGMDWVFHFAANMGGVDYFYNEQYHPTVDNFLLDLNLFRACEENKVKRVFYPSSACAYPTYFMKDGFPLEESMLNTDARPDQMYGWEKLTMTKLAEHAPFDVRVGILHTIYGPGQVYEGKKAKFPPQIAYKTVKAMESGEIEVWGDGRQTRTFLYVDDAIKMMIEVMKSFAYFGPVNIGSDKEVSIKEVVDICTKLVGGGIKIKYNLHKPTGPENRGCDMSKFEKYYSYKPKVNLSDGFSKVINYIIQNESIF